MVCRLKPIAMVIQHFCDSYTIRPVAFSFLFASIPCYLPCLSSPSVVPYISDDSVICLFSFVPYTDLDNPHVFTHLLLPSISFPYFCRSLFFLPLVSHTFLYYACPLIILILWFFVCKKFFSAIFLYRSLKLLVASQQDSKGHFLGKGTKDKKGWVTLGILAFFKPMLSFDLRPF